MLLAPRRSEPFGFSLLLLLAVLGLLQLGCSDAGPGGSAPLTYGSDGDAHIGAKPCTPGAERECGHALSQSHDVLTCYRGVQTCGVEQTWGDCVEGTVAEGPRAPSLLPRGPRPFSGRHVDLGLLRPLAFTSTTPGDCLQACDPQCYFYEEPAPELGTPEGGGGGHADFPGTPPSCAHELCTEGVALNATCDPCVKKVCDVDSTCCSTAWDSGCTDLVYTECAGTAPPLDLCDFGVFSLGPLITANRPSAGAAMGAVGNLTIGTDATPSMVVTGGDLEIFSPNGKSIVAPGGFWVAGDAKAQNGAGAVYKANWHVGGGIDLNGGNTIDGHSYAGRKPTGVVITGSNNYPSPPPTIELPTTIPPLPSTCPGGASPNISNTTRTLTPGNYGTISMSNEAKLVLDGPGTYTFTAINGTITNGGIQIGTTAAAGTYTVIVCGNFSMGNWGNIIAHSASPGTATAKTPLLANPERLVMYVGGNATFGTDNNFVGVLLIPNGKYTAADRTSVNGAVWAKDFQAGTDMNAKGLSASACAALDFEFGTQECPVANEGLPPSTNEPCETGVDCQINQRCTEVVTAACEHSKCLPGDALKKSCDSCVERICDVEPSCCTDEWTDDCVDMVSTVCDANCGEVTGCTHDMCAVGGTLEKGCDTSSCTTTVCNNPSYAYCCNDADPRGWNLACVNRAKSVCTGTPSGPSGAVMCGYAVHHGTGYTGTATVSGGTVGTGNSVTVRSVTCGAGSVTYNSGTTLAPGTHGDVTISGWGNELRLNAGTYNIKSLTIGGGSILRMPASGSVVLNVCGAVSFGQDARITGLSNGADQLRLQLYTNGNFTAGPRAYLHGVILAGNASSTTTLSGPTTHQGLLWSNGRVDMVNEWGNNPTVDNSIPPASCVASGLVPAACPVTTAPATIVENGSCESNDDGWKEPYCVGYDLAAGYVCGPTVPICNHGGEAFPGGPVTVGYWEVAAGQFATTSPNMGLGSTCTGNVPAIPPGQCSTLACAFPSGEDYTFMVDPGALLSECHGLRLDNWSYHDADVTCGGGSSVTEFEYQADCPDGTSAQWKNLTWATTMPAGSSMTFSAQVVGELGELDPVGYVPLGVAELGAVDTTVCSLSGPAPNCPVALTDALGLGRFQGQTLSLRVETNHAGGTPDVEDWSVSYTCQDDE